MKNYFDELKKIIMLYNATNKADEEYSQNPESAEAEKAFDDAYEAEFNAVENLAETLSSELGGKTVARKAIWLYVENMC